MWCILAQQIASRTYCAYFLITPLNVYAASVLYSICIIFMSSVVSCFGWNEKYIVMKRTPLLTISKSSWKALRVSWRCLWMESTVLLFSSGEHPLGKLYIYRYIHFFNWISTWSASFPQSIHTLAKGIQSHPKRMMQKEQCGCITRVSSVLLM